MFLVERNSDTIELTITVQQAKQLYLALFQRLRNAGPAGFDDFDEDDLLLDLQTYLQRKAREAGVDSTIHAEWEAFLGSNAKGACDAP